MDLLLEYSGLFCLLEDAGLEAMAKLEEDFEELETMDGLDDLDEEVLLDETLDEELGELDEVLELEGLLELNEELEEELEESKELELLEDDFFFGVNPNPPPVLFEASESKSALAGSFTDEFLKYKKEPDPIIETANILAIIKYILFLDFLLAFNFSERDNVVFLSINSW